MASALIQSTSTTATATASAVLHDADHGVYSTAVTALMGADHQAQTKAQIQAAAARRTRTTADMQEYWNRIVAHSGNTTPPPQLPRYMIHIAGTKGKGSTAIQCEAILRHRYGLHTGLYTSPHLIHVTERIRIDGKPVSRAVFGTAYWHVRRALEQGAAAAAGSDNNDGLPTLPGYFRMLTLLALHIFAHHQQPAVDVMVIEVGLGGRYDATNFITTDIIIPGITLLDYDHVRILGSHITQIAWEKAGVYAIDKTGAGMETPRPADDGTLPEALTIEPGHNAEKRHDNTARRVVFALASNPPAAIRVLEQCAATEGQGSQLVLVGSDNGSEYAIPSHVSLGLAGQHQRENAALAVAMCTELYRRQQQQQQHVSNVRSVWTDHGVNAMYKGLSQVTWPGRCQTGVSQKGYYTLRLDGAHTVQSVQAGLEWFDSVRDTTRPCILLFNCSHERNPVELLSLLATTGVFDKAIFCPADSSRPSAVAKQTAQAYLKENHVTPIVKDWLPVSDQASWEETLRSIWKHVNHNSVKGGDDSVFCFLSMTQAVAFLETEQLPAEVFVTGSLYLVGSVLTAIGWQEPESVGHLHYMSTIQSTTSLQSQQIIAYKGDAPAQE